MPNPVAIPELLVLPLLGQSLAKCVIPPQILQEPPYTENLLKYVSLNPFHFLLYTKGQTGLMKGTE